MALIARLTGARRRRQPAQLTALAAAGLLLGLAACGSPSPPAPHERATTTTTRPTVVPVPATPSAPVPAPSSPVRGPSANGRQAADPAQPGSVAGGPPTGTQLTLPLGGTRIFPAYRVVAYYGAPDNPGLGVLGAGTAEQAARAIERRAAAYRPYGRRVQPAMELLATVAQGSPGPDHDYSKPVSPAAVAAYLAVARRHHMLLVLDFQPGRGSFLAQVKLFGRFLDDPWVGVALDPEWKLGPHQVPAKVIGSASAASINAVSSYLAGIVRARRLPQKLFVVHQFTAGMLPDRAHIRIHPELATVLHADGHGSIAVKEAVYHQLAFPRPFFTGFKLFVHDDPQLMTPAQVMALVRRPDLVTYE